jgi:hypothetical protein
MENMETNAPTGVTTEGSTQQGETKTTGFYNGKYNSISDFEKSHDELQKSYSQKTAEYKERMGAFTGAPEAYEVGEGIEVSEDNPLFGKLQELGKEINLDNEGYNKLVQMYNDTMAEQEAQYEETMKQELAKLGGNAQERIQNINDWSKANLSEDEQAVINRIATDAESVQFIESMIARTKPQGMAQSHQVKANPTYSKDEIRQMQMAKDENGNRRMSTDHEYYKKVMALMAQTA